MHPRPNQESNLCCKSNVLLTAPILAIVVSNIWSCLSNQLLVITKLYSCDCHVVNKLQNGVVTAFSKHKNPIHICGALNHSKYGNTL